MGKYINGVYFKMKHYFEIKDEFNLLVDDCLAIIQMKEQDATLPSDAEKERLSEKMREKFTLVRNHIMNMILLCDESSANLDGADKVFIKKTQSILDEFINPFISGKGELK